MPAQSMKTMLSSVLKLSSTAGRRMRKLGAEVHTFLTSPLDVGECLSSHAGCFNPRKAPTGQTGQFGKGNKLTLPGIEPKFLGFPAP